MKFPLLLVCAALVALGGCATAPPSPSSDHVDELVTSRTGVSPHVAQPRATAEFTLAVPPAGPLGVNDAVRIAFMNNPRLRMAYARLGIAAADVFDASRLSNPSLSLGALDSDAGGAMMRISAALVQNLSDALLLPARRELATAAARQRAIEVAADLWNLAQDVGAAHVTAVGANQRAALRALAVRATGLAAELARRYFAAGNINRLELTLAEAAVSEAELNAAMAAADADAARIRLQQLLGFHGEQQIELPAGLLLPVASEDELPALQALAMHESLDLKAAAAAAAFRSRLSCMASACNAGSSSSLATGSSSPAGNSICCSPWKPSSCCSRIRAASASAAAIAALSSASLTAASASVNSRRLILPAAK